MSPAALCLAALAAAGPGVELSPGAIPEGLEPGTWERVEAGEVVTLLREVEGSAIKEGVALALVDAPAARVFRVVTDNESFEEFMPHVRESEVERAADGAVINYQLLEVPFAGDRHYRIRVDNGVERETGGPVYYSRWTYVPGSGNIIDTRGSWTLVPRGAGRTLAVYRVLTDPGGKIPSWIVNLASHRALDSLVEAVRRRVPDPRYGDTPPDPNPDP